MQSNNGNRIGNKDPRRVVNGLDGLSVLVVEDRHAIANWVVRMLRLLGCQPVGPAPSIEAGLAWLEREQGDFDAALLDVDLKGKTVYPLARALVEARVPIVFATGYGSPAIAEEWREFPKIEKPFQANDLERALLRALACPQHAPGATNETYDMSETVRRAWDTIREGRNAHAEALVRTERDPTTPD
jgi:DNA-binding NtrC family response regulator